jgi:hypothetical protein
VIEAIDGAVGPVKQRDRGFGAGELLAGIAAAQLAGEDFLTGLDRQRADAAGQQLTPVPGLSSTTAGGLARRVTPAQWHAVETGLAAVTAQMVALLPPARAAALTGGPVTIDLDATDVEVYGSKKRGVAWNHQGQRVGRPHVAAWAETEIVLARAARDEGIDFAIGAKRIAPLSRLLDGIADDDWHEAIDMDGAQVAVAGYCPDSSIATTARPPRRRPRRAASSSPATAKRRTTPHRREGVSDRMAEQPLGPVRRFVPSMPGDTPPVPLRQLAHHRSRVLAGLQPRLCPGETRPQ